MGRVEGVVKVLELDDERENGEKGELRLEDDNFVDCESGRRL